MIFGLMNENSGHRSNLRARFLEGGLKAFVDHEVLELFLTLCIPRRDVKKQAKSLLKQFGSVRNVFEAPIEDLVKVCGVGEITCVNLKIVKELAVRYLQDCVKKGPLFNNNESLISFWKARLGGLRHEVFEAAYLDNQFWLLQNGIERIEEGVANRTMVYPQKVMSAALKKSAANIVIAHNHPSGNEQPSENDFKLTQSLKYAGDVLGVRLLDHIIVTDEKFYSFRQAGFLD